MLTSMYGDQCQIVQHGAIGFFYQASEFCS